MGVFANDFSVADAFTFTPTSDPTGGGGGWASRINTLVGRGLQTATGVVDFLDRLKDRDTVSPTDFLPWLKSDDEKPADTGSSAAGAGGLGPISPQTLAILGAGLAAVIVLK